MVRKDDSMASKNELYLAKQNMILNKAMQKIDDNANGILFIIDDDNRLCGAITDGDIRRWLLKGGSIYSSIDQVMNVSPISITNAEVKNAKEIMHKKSIRALPVVDIDRVVIDIILAKELENGYEKVREKLQDVSVVIMAGGKGTRLYPYTKILPKPLIPIGEIPIIERVMDMFNSYGIIDFYMTVKYKKNMIKSYFSETVKEYEIKYVEETVPLGTGGGIKLIDKKMEKPLFVANSDSLIRTDYVDLYKHHLENDNSITIVTALKNDNIPYGVIESDENGRLVDIVEKPTRSYLINTGMYIINPDMIDLIPDNVMYHMTDLINDAKQNGYKVGIYPISEDSFLDMGEFAEMKRMEEKLNIQ